MFLIEGIVGILYLNFLPYKFEWDSISSDPIKIDTYLYTMPPINYLIDLWSMHCPHESRNW